MMANTKFLDRKCIICKQILVEQKNTRKSCSEKCLKKYQSLLVKGDKNPATKKEVKNKISKSMKSFYKKGGVNPMKGKKRIDLVEYNKKFKPLQTKEKNPNWQGGIGKYGSGFTNILKNNVREKYELICQICNKNQNEFSEKLHVHHIDYNKKNNSIYNFICLCRSCHISTNFNRKYWIEFFNNKRAKKYEETNKISIHICTKDRHSELALLLQSLRTQYFKNFDIIILDDASGTPVLQCQFLTSLINRMKLEGHRFKIIRNPQSFGCCAARNKCIEEDDFDDANLILRVDDDVILEPNYILRLIDAIEDGYDLVTGVVPMIMHPEMKRDTKYVKPIINKHEFDKDGNLIMNKDECGFCYMQEETIPTNQFRTNALYKSEIHKKVRYPDNLTTVAFREEGFFSFGAILAGYKLGVNTGAVCYHFATPSGGNRRQDYAECVKIDEETWRKWLKKKFDKHGDFLNKYNEEVKNDIYKR